MQLAHELGGFGRQRASARHDALCGGSAGLPACGTARAGRSVSDRCLPRVTAGVASPPHILGRGDPERVGVEIAVAGGVKLVRQARTVDGTRPRAADRSAYLDAALERAGGSAGITNRSVTDRPLPLIAATLTAPPHL